MKKGHFYYIKDEYFKEFDDSYLMKNKEVVNGKPHDRPCFYAFLDNSTGLYWLIPFSSQTEKYKKYYNQKIAKFKRCDTIAFGQVLGYEKAFLIQNMCPVLPKYINSEYINREKPVRIDGKFEKELQTKARKVLALQRQGRKIIFPDVLKIEKKLIEKI